MGCAASALNNVTGEMEAKNEQDKIKIQNMIKNSIPFKQAGLKMNSAIFEYITNPTDVYFENMLFAVMHHDLFGRYFVKTINAVELKEAKCTFQENHIPERYEPYEIDESFKNFHTLVAIDNISSLLTKFLKMKHGWKTKDLGLFYEKLRDDSGMYKPSLHQEESATDTRQQEEQKFIMENPMMENEVMNSGIRALEVDYEKLSYHKGVLTFNRLIDLNVFKTIKPIQITLGKYDNYYITDKFWLHPSSIAFAKNPFYKVPIIIVNRNDDDTEDTLPGYMTPSAYMMCALHSYGKENIKMVVEEITKVFPFKYTIQSGGNKQTINLNPLQTLCTRNHVYVAWNKQIYKIAKDETMIWKVVASYDINTQMETQITPKQVNFAYEQSEEFNVECRVYLTPPESLETLHYGKVYIENSFKLNGGRYVSRRVPYEKRKVPELKALAMARRIPNAKTMKKDELITALRRKRLQTVDAQKQV